MLNVSYRGGCLVMLAVAVSGCFNLDFGSGDIAGCSATPESVAMKLEARYALGAETTLSLSGLETPSITSSNPEVIRVGQIDSDDRVMLSFVGVGEASITVSDATDYATASVAVAELESFEVALPSYNDPLIPLSGKSLIDPAFQVAYFDSEGRLYGRGLAETSWPSAETYNADVFYNPSLEPGPQVVEVRVGALESTILFGAVAPDDVVALEILETDLGQGRIRVDAVGLTESGTQVWNINPYFQVDNDFFILSFEYIFDPNAPPSLVIAQSFLSTSNGPLDPAEKEIHRAPSPDAAAYATIAPPARRAPVMALLSLLLMALAIQAGARGFAVRASHFPASKRIA